MDHHSLLGDDALSDSQVRALVGRDLDRRLDHLTTGPARQLYLLSMAQAACGKLALETSPTRAAADMRPTMRTLTEGNYTAV